MKSFNGRFRNILTGLVIILIQNQLLGQGLVQNGGFMVVNQGAHVVIDGSQGHYFDTLDGKINILDSGYIHVPGDWTNNSSDHVFSTNHGMVLLNGGPQNIQGIMRTSFPGLTLSGTAEKSLQIDALVGGGHGGGGAEALNLLSQNLALNSQTLIVNNPGVDGIRYSSNGIISETNSTVGYGKVQWNCRDQIGLYRIPFISTNTEPIPVELKISTVPVQANDSGFFTAATYPTDPGLVPNNRVLPTGVLHTENTFGRENDFGLVDRFWIFEDGGLSFPLTADISFSYLEGEWDNSNGSKNDIEERNLHPIVYESFSNQWDYGLPISNNIAQNKANTGIAIIKGVWTLSDTIPCPSADFEWVGSCEQLPISFLDLSLIESGSIEDWSWNFGDNSTSNDQHPIHVFTSSGPYSVQLVVIANSGCPDSVEKNTNIGTKAFASFSVPDDPLVGIPLSFLNQSTNSSNWSWEFGDNGSSNAKNPQYVYSDEGSYDVFLIANNSANCPDTTFKTIYLNQPSLFLLPNAFSPGTTDDINGSFGLSTLQKVSDYHLAIYNRWGEQIFESNKINEKWHGDYLGEPVMDGNYVYTLSFRDRSGMMHYKNGTVLLMRN